MKTFQRRIKAAYLGASIKMIKSRREKEGKQNLTHCCQIRSAWCRIMRKVWGFYRDFGCSSVSQKSISAGVLVDTTWGRAKEWLELSHQTLCSHVLQVTDDVWKSLGTKAISGYLCSVYTTKRREPLQIMCGSFTHWFYYYMRHTVPWVLSCPQWKHTLGLCKEMLLSQTNQRFVQNEWVGMKEKLDFHLS